MNKTRSFKQYFKKNACTDDNAQVKRSMPHLILSFFIVGHSASGTDFNADTIVICLHSIVFFYTIAG